MNEDVIEVDVSDQTLKQTPERALTFLRGVGTNEMIRAILKTVGYTEAEHNEGWKLLQEASGYGAQDGFSVATIPVTDAIAELDAWDEGGFRVINATLSRHFPEQAKFVMEGLAPSQGAAAILGVATLLGRLDELEGSADRKATRKQDAKALELLATRGITPQLRKHLAEKVKVAQSVQLTKLDPQAIEKRNQAQREALARLRSWFSEWSDIARVQLTRRDYLITLGLAARRVSKDPVPEPGPEPTPGTPTSAPA